ncbi:hypothetical protein E2C01_019242 [Portunus trituberculatus]|uniref:Uncharacterized protein n=1 Tax=Portunus trituberculatus TaxID=210409 RepID=A0A5B7DX22_PORTR|nr:hypothetical protein [Portunus trituberculatus]
MVAKEEKMEERRIRNSRKMRREMRELHRNTFLRLTISFPSLPHVLCVRPLFPSPLPLFPSLPRSLPLSRPPACLRGTWRRPHLVALSPFTSPPYTLSSVASHFSLLSSICCN